MLRPTRSLKVFGGLQKFVASLRASICRVESRRDPLVNLPDHEVIFAECLFNDRNAAGFRFDRGLEVPACEFALRLLVQFQRLPMRFQLAVGVARPSAHKPVLRQLRRSRLLADDDRLNHGTEGMAVGRPQVLTIALDVDLATPIGDQPVLDPLGQHKWRQLTPLLNPRLLVPASFDRLAENHLASLLAVVLGTKDRNHHREAVAADQREARMARFAAQTRLRR
jgi:hypothetical protein